MTKHRKILVIDDGIDTRKILHQILTANHFSVQEAATGAAGLALAQKEAPDLIVLDLMMPGQDGIETYRALKEDPNTSSTPVIFLTALSSGNSLTPQGLELMAQTKYGQNLNLDDNCVILGKFFNPKKLIQEVEKILEKADKIKKDSGE